MVPENPRNRKEKGTESACSGHRLHPALRDVTAASRNAVAVLDRLVPNLLWEQRSWRAERGGLLLRLRCPREGMWSEARPYLQASHPRGRRGPLRRYSPKI